MPAAPEGPFRTCYGSEFCQTLLPSAAGLREAWQAMASEHGAFTLLTPPVDDHGLERVARLLGVLAERPGEKEVVVNDWGVLRLLRGWRGQFRPVLGRLLTKMLRDPRILPTTESGEDAAVPLPMQQSGITASAQLGVLRAEGVEWVEVDNLRQGVRIDFGSLGLKPSVHLPFGLVTSGRVCLFAGLHQPRAAKFSPQTACQRECHRYQATMTDPAARAGDAELVQQGNTVFYRQDPGLIERGLSWAEAQRGRVVLRRGPFDEVGHITEDVALARRWLQGASA